MYKFPLKWGSCYPWTQLLSVFLASRLHLFSLTLLRKRHYRQGDMLRAETRWWRTPLNLLRHQFFDVYWLCNLRCAVPGIWLRTQVDIVRAACRGKVGGETKMNICRVARKPVQGREELIGSSCRSSPCPVTSGTRSAILCPAGRGVVNQINNCGKGKLRPASSRLLMLASNYTCQSSQDAMCNYQLSLSTA